jgi:hypothetical protein
LLETGTLQRVVVQLQYPVLADLTVFQYIFGLLPTLADNGGILPSRIGLDPNAR